VQYGETTNSYSTGEKIKIFSIEVLCLFSVSVSDNFPLVQMDLYRCLLNWWGQKKYVLWAVFCLV
jgi:hypothetical protein